MSEFKVRQKVRIRSLEWLKKNCYNRKDGGFTYSKSQFIMSAEMAEFAGKEVTITKRDWCFVDGYDYKGDMNVYKSKGMSGDYGWGQSYFEPVEEKK